MCLAQIVFTSLSLITYVLYLFWSTSYVIGFLVEHLFVVLPYFINKVIIATYYVPTLLSQSDNLIRP